ncbi:hypothetical protein DUHN57_06830 [Helicobacter pylori]|nr:hypothetical protein VN0338_13320 [Helicobacter pylori]
MKSLSSMTLKPKSKSRTCLKNSIVAKSECLLGSPAKMGVGTNVQARLVAMQEIKEQANQEVHRPMKKASGGDYAMGM